MYRPYTTDPKCKRLVDLLRSYRANIRHAYIVHNSCVVDFEHPRLPRLLKKHTGVFPAYYQSSTELDLDSDVVRFNIITPTEEKKTLEVELPPSDAGYRIHLLNDEPKRIGIQGAVPLSEFRQILDSVLLDP